MKRFLCFTVVKISCLSASQLKCEFTRNKCNVISYCTS